MFQQSLVPQKLLFVILKTSQIWSEPVCIHTSVYLEISVNSSFNQIAHKDEHVIPSHHVSCLFLVHFN